MPKMKTKSAAKKRLAVIIVCPYQHLVDQWVEDIVKFNVKLFFSN